MRKLLGIVCLLPVLSYADDFKARFEGADLVLTGRAGAKVRLLDAAEKLLASGQVDASGALVLAAQAGADPMLRLVEIDGRRAALSDLFPAVELMAVLPAKLSAGLDLVPHVRVLNRRAGGAASGVAVDVALECGKERHTLGTMQSDAHGVATPSTPLRVPALARGGCTLILRGAGATLTGAVSVTRGVRLLLSSDRPVYQPGGSVHLRGLALDAATGMPVAGEKATLELKDPRGGVLGRQEATTSAFGLVNAELALSKTLEVEAVEARVTLGGESESRRLKVGRYLPPRVTVGIAPESPSVRLGQVARATVTVSRLDGGPAAGTSVDLMATSETGAELFRARGVADASGVVVLSGTVAAPAKAIKLSARVEPATGDIGNATVDLAVDDGTLAVYLIPESGRVLPGVSNGFWVVAARPDGAPASADVEVVAAGAKATGHTDADGIAFVRLAVPAGGQRVVAHARDGARRGHRTIEAVASSGLLLRLDPPVATAGGRVALDVAAPGRDGVVIVDLVQAEHPVTSVVVPLSGGAGRAELTLPATASGTMRMHAWHVDSRKAVASDTRLLLVDDARDLTVTLTPDRETYQPRMQAGIEVHVVDAQGRPKVAAVGLVAVDEGLRALGLEQPGVEQALARLGTMWTKRSVEVPPWAQSALYVARDRRRLAILAAAAEAEFALTAPRDTEATRAAAAGAAFTSAVQRRADKIAGALTRWYHGDKARRKKPVEGSVLAEKRLLALSDLRDPWGRAVRLRLDVNRGCCEYSVVVLSAGVDGIEGNRDDVTASAEFKGWSTDLCGCGYGGLGMRGVGLGAGGHSGHVAYAMMGSASVRTTPMRTEFPETLAVQPALITGPDGKALWRVQLADSLTRWLVQARVVTKDGGLGAAEATLRVEQPFSVDASLPPTLTRLDEIEVPIGLTNRSSSPREVTVSVTAGGALSGGFEGTITVPAHGSAPVPVRVTAARVGEGFVEMTARGEGVADSVRRTLTVEPDGVPVEEVRSGSVSQADPGHTTIGVPRGGIPGTRKLTLRLYPSAVGAVVEGLDALLASPGGCFEQTSSTTYPNALVLDYLKRSKKASPELTQKAQAFLAAGWKRLTSFEVTGGGFSWFGDAPANKILTAFGVMEFERIGTVYTVDPDVARRTRAWLLAQRQPDGSYEPDKAYLHADSWAKVQNASLPVTAYIVWALARGGRPDDVAPSVAWIRAHTADAKDAYVQALVALALSAADAAADPSSRARTALAGLATVEDASAMWSTAMSTATYAGGHTAGLETTGLSALAMLAGGDHDDLSKKALNGLMGKRMAGGGWGSTQATTLALEALLESEARSTSPASGTIVVTEDGKEAARLRVTEADFDVVRTVTLPARAGSHEVTLAMEGTGQLRWQLAATRNVAALDAPKSTGPLALTVTADRTAAGIGEDVHVTVHLEASSRSVRMPTITVGLPAGCELVETSLAQAKVSKHEVLGRRLVLYLEQLQPGEAFDTTFTLTARRAGLVAPGLASAWPYYEPDGVVRVEQAKLAIAR